MEEGIQKHFIQNVFDHIKLRNARIVKVDGVSGRRNISPVLRSVVVEHPRLLPTSSVITNILGYC
jgi:hypothetical protein